MSTAPRKSRRQKLAAGAAVALGAAIAPDATAAVITVNSTADTEVVDGQCTLREAVRNANDNAATRPDCAAGAGVDTINFALAFPATINLATELLVSDSVTIDGPGQTRLTIDAGGNDRIFSFQDANLVSAMQVEIDDLTLAHGDATGQSVPGGGAILSAENLTVTNVTFTGNVAEAGGAIFQTSDAATSTLTVTSSTFRVNEALYGGAIFAEDANLAITGSTFSLNYAVSGGAIAHALGDFSLANSSVTENEATFGGGISLYYTGVVITNSTISGNNAAVVGGLYIYGPSGVTIEDSVISGNEALTYVGGLHISDASETPVYIRDTEISGNVAGNGTGGLYLYDLGPVTLERVRLIDNTAANANGGAALWGVGVTIVESQITGNEAASTGGLYAAYGTYLYLINSTVANNTATTGSVGGIGVNQSYAFIDVSTISGNSAPAGAAGNLFLYGSGLYVANSIIANGTALAAPDLLTATSSATINYSLIENPTGATFSGANNITGVDPQLGPLQNNGGPTETMLPALTSPVIDAGDPAYTTPPNDQRGFPRPVGEVDMGAVEVSAGVLSFSLNAYAVSEAGGLVTITVTRTGGSDGAVSVQYATSNVTAVAGTDYTAASGTLNWAHGDATPKSFNVAIAEDAIFEGNETFNVTLSNAVGATLGTAAAPVTINDNDAAPTISIADGAATEGHAGTTPATFTVTLSNPTAQTVTVEFATTGGSAVSGTDFQPAGGTLTFNPGQTSQPVTVQVIGDTLDEPNETFTVALANPNANATILDGSATGTITDDDGAPALSIGDMTLPEGNAGPTSFVFTVTLAPASGQTVTVDYTTQNVTAIAGTDYTETAGTLTFTPGDTSETITVPVLGDTAIEPDETFQVVLSNAPLATIGDNTGVGTIANDDTPLTADLSVTKAIVGTGPFFAGTNAQFTITVANAGPAAATNVHVLDAIPTGTTFVSAVSTAGTCTGTVTVDCSVGTLAGGGSATITLTVNLTTAGAVSNTATASSDVTDPTPAAGTANITVVPAAAGEAIPTLSEWMLLALATAIAAAAALKLKQ